MKVKILKAELKQFKGIKEATYSFDGCDIKITGQNGVGKSSIADAWYWTFDDCDYRLQSNPMIRPVGVDESLPSVTWTFDVDGTVCTIQKRQESLGAAVDGGKVRVSNKYQFNSIPVTERDLWKKLESLGINSDMFLALSHPAVFTSKYKTTEMRSILFGMAKGKTDLEIAKSELDTVDVAVLLESYTADEIRAMNKATVKNAKERVASIPNIIVGMEQAKTSDSVEELQKEKDGILEEKAKVHLPDISAIRKEYAEKTDAINTLKADISNRKYAAQTAARKKLAEVIDKANDVDQNLYLDERKLEKLESEARIVMEQIQKCRDRHADLKRQYDALDDKGFPEFVPPTPLTENDMVCPTCGQKLTMKLRAEKQADYEKDVRNKRMAYDMRKADWEAMMRDDRARISSASKKNADHIKTLNQELKEIGKKKQELLVVIDACKTDLAEAKKLVDDERERFTHLDEYHDLEEARLEQLTEERTELEHKIAEAEAKKDVLATFDYRIADVDKRIARAEHNAKIDDDIANMNRELLRNEQEKANAEKILDELNILAKRKNELLTDEINSHFKVVRFKLFDYLKNGEIDNKVCIPTIDGKAFGESLNTGKELIGKLDICEGLQNFYDEHLPVFLDNAESLNTFNVPNIDTQLILLSVTDDKELAVHPS